MQLVNVSTGLTTVSLSAVVDDNGSEAAVQCEAQTVQMGKYIRTQASQYSHTLYSQDYAQITGLTSYLLSRLHDICVRDGDCIRRSHHSVDLHD